MRDDSRMVGGGDARGTAGDAAGGLAGGAAGDVVGDAASGSAGGFAGDAAGGSHSSVVDAFARHLRLERGFSDHTVRAYIGDVRDLLAATGVADGEGLADLTLAGLRSWLAGLQMAGRSRATMARRAAAARAFTAWAERTGRLVADPAVRLVAPRPANVLPEILTIKEAALVLDLAKTRADDGGPISAIGL